MLGECEHFPSLLHIACRTNVNISLDVRRGFYCAARPSKHICLCIHTIFWHILAMVLTFCTLAHIYIHTYLFTFNAYSIELSPRAQWVFLSNCMFHILDYFYFDCVNTLGVPILVVLAFLSSLWASISGCMGYQSLANKLRLRWSQKVVF